MEMNISKGAYGWKAETHIELEGGRLLDITTLKANGGLRSRAQCYRRENGFITYVLFGDYSATLAASQARCTEKAVADLHRQALGKLDEIKAEVVAFYAAKGE
ncbi:hypothetical protein UFOVP653_40 [uncultured Caudovirales phage]|uniref:Uncharacterized protein n=1 Tax=uncultured Caudovirales phage TaxID=2100421 RepID=A0A6J5N5W5_9CAUD|nr:hypothetical protein UFOVP653_40 [uncultured Caudovirales phage]